MSIAHDFDMARMLTIEKSITDILAALGYDISDQHFTRTPKRVAQVLLDLRKNGNPQVVKDLLEVQFIEEGAVNSLVIEGPISYTSMCAHHMLPVTGQAWVGYLPSARVCGLSKLARVTYHFAEQLTVQERVTQQIADALVTHLEPEGAMVVVRAIHGCMSVRGIRERNTETVTSAVRGVFRDSAAARAEFLSLIGGSS